MKKIYTTFAVIVAFVQFSYAQWISTPPYLYTTTNNLVGIGINTPKGLLSLAGNRTTAAWGLAGVNFQSAAATYTDSTSLASGIIANNMINTFGIPTLSATKTGVTYTNAATVYIAGPPAAGANTTITNKFALSVVGKINATDEFIGAGIGSYGHSVLGLTLDEPDGYQYLMLVKKSSTAGSTSVAGTLTGKRNNNSGAGKNSASIYVNIRAQNGGDSQAYWESDAAGTSTGVRLVTLTYDNGDGPATWYAIDATHAGASVATFGNASFDGHAGSAIFKWVGSGDVSNVAVSNSDSYKNFGGQMVINTAGNVGIGSLTPIAPLDVNSSAGSVIRFTSKVTHGTTAGAGMLGYSDPGYAMTNGDRLGYYLLGGSLDSAHTLINTAGMLAYASEAWSGSSTGTSLAFNVTPNGKNARIEAMRIVQSGNVGIGTNNSNYRLTVMGPVNNQKALFTRDGVNGLFLSSDADATKYNWSIASHVNVTNALEFTPSATAGGTTFTNPAMVVLATGSVGIGTTDPHNYKLAVNGNAIATSMTVKPYANWPDYVFKKDYKLLSLSDVKNYIDQNQHLPDMPSEVEIAKDGLNLGEVMKIQTKKIEELTLYLIDKDKQLNKLESELLELKKQVSAIKKSNSKNK